MSFCAQYPATSPTALVFEVCVGVVSQQRTFLNVVRALLAIIILPGTPERFNRFFLVS
jgi:hypothetical protein